MQLTKSQLASIIGITVRTLTTWQHDPDFPAPTRQGSRCVYDGHAVITWWHNREIARLIESDDGKLLDLNHERARLARAQADRQLLALARERREVAPIEAIGDAVGDEYERVRARLLAMPAKTAPMLAHESSINACRAILDHAVREALEELSAPETIVEKVDG